MAQFPLNVIVIMDNVTILTIVVGLKIKCIKISHLL